MPRTFAMLLGMALAAGCRDSAIPVPTPAAAARVAPTQTLSEAREGFKTQLPRLQTTKEDVPDPPPRIFRLVSFPSAVGQLAAYLTPDPKDGKQHPAIIWITGGDCNSIGDVWGPMPASNDQTA